MSEILKMESVRKRFDIDGHGSVYAVNGVTLPLEKGTTVGLIGESGSGKSTLGRIALGLIEPDSGSVTIDGESRSGMTKAAGRKARSKVQAVFQEPYESLNPRMTVGSIIQEPLIINQPSWTRGERQSRVAEVMEEVGLEADLATRRPRALSGGQQQRVGIARAIVNQPLCVILDEPTSSLDLSVRAQIIALLGQLQRDHGMTYLLITHDVSTVAQLSDHIAVLYLGRIVEEGPTAVVLAEPRHPYTQALLSAQLSPNPTEQAKLLSLPGDPPRPTELRSECPLCGRCPHEIPVCRRSIPPLLEIGPKHWAACTRANETLGEFASSTFAIRDEGLPS